MAEHAAQRSRVRTRTRAEYVAVIGRVGIAAAGIAAGIGLVLHLVTSGVSGGIPSAAGLPVVGWHTVAYLGAGVGCAAAAAVALLARPRDVLTGDGGRTGVPEGFGQLWAGPRAPAADGVPRDAVAAVEP